MIKQTTIKDHWILPLALVLVSCPTWLTIFANPTLFAIPAAIFGIWFFNRQGHWFLSGLLTAICLYRPEYLPFIVIPGLILGRFFYLGGLVVAGLGVYLVTQAMHLELSLPGLLAASITGPSNMLQNFNGFLTLLLGDNVPQLPIAVNVIYGALIVGATELWWRLRSHPISQQKYLKKAAATMLMMLVGSPHVYAQDYIAFIPVATWLWIATIGDTRSNATTIRRLVIAFPIISWLFYFAAPAFIAIRIPAYFAWGLTLATVILPTLDDEKLTTKPA